MMRLFRFDAAVARPVRDCASPFRIVPLLMATQGEARVHCMYLQPGDSIGLHNGQLPQLFCVVHGSGWVTGPTGERQPIAAGQAAFWEAGEGHAAGTDAGMTAFTIQSPELDPTMYLGLAGLQVA